MTEQVCIRELKKALPEISTDDEAKRIIELYKKYKKKGLDIEDIKNQATIDLFADYLQEARKARMKALDEEAVKSVVERVINSGLTSSQGLRSVILGVVARGRGSHFNIGVLQRQELSGRLNAIERQVSSLDIQKLRSDTEFQRQFFGEMVALDNPKGRSGFTGNANALRVAKVFNTELKGSLHLANAAGAHIPERIDHVFRVAHDTRLMMKAGPSKWIQDIIPLLHESYKLEKKDLVATLNTTYRKIVAGEARVHAPINIAETLSAPRKLRFKDADAILTYNEKYSRLNPLEQMYRLLEYRAGMIGIMKVLGPNARENLGRIVDRLRDWEATIPGGSKDLKKITHANAEKWLSIVDGKASLPENFTLSGVGGAIRALQVVSKLGSATISAVGDVPNAAGNLYRQGAPLLKGWSDILSRFFKGRPKGELRNIASEIGVFSESLIGTSASRFFADGVTLGEPNKFVRLMFKLNLMDWWNDSLRRSFVLSSSHHLALLANRPFAKLPEKTRHLFKQYDIRPEDWHMFQMYGLQKADDGRHYMTVEGLKNIRSEQLQAYLGRKEPLSEIEKLGEIDKLVSKLRGFFIDRSDHAVITPDAGARSIMTQGIRSGTYLGEAIRMFMQFKGFPLENVRRNMGQFLLNTPNGYPDVLGLAHMVIGSTLLGYVALSAKALARGQTLEVFGDNPKLNRRLFLSAMIQGGGLGIYADFLFGQYDKYGRSFLNIAAGPSLGQLDTIARIFTRLKRLESPGVEGVKLLTNNVPFANLFYTKFAFDYLLAQSLYESVSPGYLKRLEKLLKNEYSREFILPPSKHATFLGVSP